MPYVFGRVNALLERALVGKAECLDLIKMYEPGLVGLSTQNWREGANVMSSPKLARGTAIATFFDGKFPRRDTGQHAAIFFGAFRFWLLGATQELGRDRSPPHRNPAQWPAPR